MNDIHVDMVSFSILKNARQAKNLAYQALKKARSGDLEEAARLLDESEQAAALAQASEAELLTFDMTGREFLREHSQDHLVSSLMATEMIREMVGMYHNEDAKWN